MELDSKFYVFCFLSKNEDTNEHNYIYLEKYVDEMIV